MPSIGPLASKNTLPHLDRRGIGGWLGVRLRRSRTLEKVTGANTMQMVQMMRGAQTPTAQRMLQNRTWVMRVGVFDMMAHGMLVHVMLTAALQAP